MHGQHIHVLQDQAVRRFTLLGRVVPGIDPHHFNRGVGVGHLRAQGEGVDATDHFGNGEGGHVPDLVGVAHGTGSHAGQVARLVGPGLIVTDVARGLVTGGVFVLHLGKAPRDFQGRVHVAERGGENQIVATGGHVADHPLGIGPFGDAFDVGSFDFVSELFGHNFSRPVVHVGPARIANGTDVDKTDLERFGRLAGQAPAQQGGGESQ